MFAIYSNCKAILPTSELAVPPANKGPFRLKAIVVAPSIYSFSYFVVLTMGAT